MFLKFNFTTKKNCPGNHRLILISHQALTPSPWSILICWYVWWGYHATYISINGDLGGGTFLGQHFSKLKDAKDVKKYFFLLECFSFSLIKILKPINKGLDMTAVPVVAWSLRSYNLNNWHLTETKWNLVFLKSFFCQQVISSKNSCLSVASNKFLHHFRFSGLLSCSVRSEVNASPPQELE